MNRKTALPLSLGIHALLILGVWQAWHFADSNPPQKPSKILITLESYDPQVQVQPTFTPPAKTIPQAEPEKVRPIPIQKSPIPEPIKTPVYQTPVTAVPTAVPSPKIEPIKEPAEPVRKISESPAPVIKPAPPPPPPAPKISYTDEHLGTIRTILQERLVYPKMAIKLRQQGEVKMGFSLSPSGEVSDISVESSSGFSLLDSAAEKLIRDSAPEFPKPHQKVRISIPIGYRLR